MNYALTQTKHDHTVKKYSPCKNIFIMSPFKAHNFHVSKSNTFLLIITHPCSWDLNSSRYHATLTITNSFSSHANFTPNPSSTVHESCHAYIILHYIHVSQYSITPTIQTRNDSQSTRKIGHMSKVLASLPGKMASTRSRP